jgi:hypothetical protein
LVTTTVLTDGTGDELALVPAAGLLPPLLQAATSNVAAIPAAADTAVA